jgi:MEMO1 family protein
MSGVVRDSPLAGRFFPAEPAELAELVDRLLADAGPARAQRRRRMLLVPHAALVWSGAVAAAAYARLAGSQARRALLVGPSHFVPFRGLAVAPYAGYRTPLGTLCLDRRACDELGRRGPLFCGLEEPHGAEHALEVQLPFLQSVLPACALVPVLCGARLDRAALLAAAEGLASVWSDDALLIVSSDFTHYGPSFGYTPFPAAEAPERIRALDAGAIRAIRRLDVQAFLDYVDQTRATICGRRAIAIGLRLLQLVAPDLSIELVGYARSADRTGDFTESVSYAALVGS